jgi:hypothetical protein
MHVSFISELPTYRDAINSGYMENLPVVCNAQELKNLLAAVDYTLIFYQYLYFDSQQKKDLSKVVTFLNDHVHEKNQSLQKLPFASVADRVRLSLGYSSLFFPTLENRNLSEDLDLQAGIEAIQLKRVAKKIKSLWQAYCLKNLTAGKVILNGLKRDQAARQIQRSFRRRNLNLYQSFFERASRRLPDLSEIDFKKRFECVRRLGGGWDGEVHEVLDRYSGLRKALKMEGFINYKVPILPVQEILNQEGSYQDKPSRGPKYIAGLITTVVQDVLSRELSPHLCRIDESFNKVVTRSGKASLQNGVLMELLDGDLHDLFGAEAFQDLRGLNRVALEVQRASVSWILESFYGTEAKDVHDANIFFKRLEDSDCFKGKKMSSYEYWKYRVNDDEFYIPCPPVLIKLGDFDRWVANIKPVKGQDGFDMIGRRYPRTAERYFNCVSSSLEEYREMFKKPDVDDCLILDMTVKESFTFQYKNPASFTHPDPVERCLRSPFNRTLTWEHF